MRKQPQYDISLDLGGTAGAGSADHISAPASAHEFMTGEREVDLDLVRIDGGTQARVAIDEPTVKTYAEAYQEKGARALDAGVLFFDGVHHWLGNGFHRYHAARRAGLAALPYEIRSGTQRDARLFALGPANRKNGLPMSNVDKRNAVSTMLADPEWSTWTSRRIADHIGCSHTLVDNMVKEREEAERKAKEAAPGAELPDASGNGCQKGNARRLRRALRGGKEMTVDTARPRRAEAPPQEDRAITRRHEDAGKKPPPPGGKLFENTDREQLVIKLRLEKRELELRVEALEKEIAKMGLDGVHDEQDAERKGYEKGETEALKRVAGWLQLKVGRNDGPEYIASLIEERLTQVRRELIEQVRAKVRAKAKRAKR